jgi:hypothetical protein
VNGGFPTGAGCLLGGQTRVFPPVAIDEVHGAIGQTGPGKCRDGFNHIPKLTFLTPQLLDTDLILLGETELLLGVRAKDAYADSEFSFEVGDGLLLYTDGLLDAENAAGESFGDAALATFIKERQESGAGHFVDLLLKEVLAWSCDEPRGAGGRYHNCRYRHLSSRNN